MPRLLAEWGDDRTRYADGNSVQALAYYQRKRSEGKTHSIAVRALANVWVRIVYRLWQDRTSYQAVTFEAAQLAHAPRRNVA